MLIHDDCLNALEYLETQSVDLVYLDPPFFTQKKHRQRTRDNTKEYVFEDCWDSIDNYRQYIEDRLDVCHKILKDTGSIFLHCDKTASHHLRLALDKVFGSDNFQSEIIWTFRRWSNAKKGLLNGHQVILFYSKSASFKFYQIYQAYSPATNIDQIFQERVRDAHGKSVYKKNGFKPILREDKKGVPLSDVWDMPYLNPKAKERVGYPTQKPIELLERVISLVTKEGDLVFDPFCGSGTSLVAARLMNRRYSGIDLSLEAIKLAQHRIKHPIKSSSTLLRNGRASFNNQCSEIVDFLERINVYPVQRNKGIDGFLKQGNSIKPIPVKVQRMEESFASAKDKLLKACKSSDFEVKILISQETPTRKYFHKEKLYIIPSALASHEHIRSTVLKDSC
ncbi:MAG: site-specific DNA-methyltransferase [Oligoflexales bacterium]